jgi:hypothetical protein
MRTLIIILLLIANIVFGQTGQIFVNQDMTGHKIINLGTPTLDGDAANKAYVDTHGGGGGGGAAWGSITGTLSAQTDLQTALDSKQPIDADLTAIAALSGTHNIYYRSAANTWSSVTIGSGLDFTGATLSATGSGGNVSNTGTPLDNQVAVFTDATHIEGNSNLSFDSSTNILSTGIVSPVTGFRINGAAANRRILVGNATNFVQSTETYAVPGTSGNVMQSDGTNWTSAQLNFSALSGNWTLAQGPSTTASKLLGRTDASAGIPQEITLGTNLAMSGTTLNATGGGSIASTTDILKGNGSGGAVALGTATTGKILKSNGTTFVASTETYAAPGTTGNVLTSDGTNWTSAANTPTVTAPLTLTVSDAATTTSVDALILGHNSSGAPGTNFGTKMTLRGKSSSTNDRDMGVFSALWATSTDGSRKSFIEIAAADNAGLATSAGLMLYSDGGVNMSTFSSTSPGAFILNANGFTINSAAPTSGRMLQSNGTSYGNSTATWPTTAGTAGYTVRSDGTNFASYPQDVLNSSVSSQSPSTADVYLTGSNVVVAAGDFKAKGQYRCLFDVTKSAGTGAIVISVRAGTTGSTSDTAQLTFTFPAGTGVADVGTFEVIVTWRTVGSGTSAVIQGVCRAQKNTVTAAGLWGDTSAAKVIVATTSSGFASNTFTNMGLSFNGSTAFAGTVTLVQASLLQ